MKTMLAIMCLMICSLIHATPAQDVYQFSSVEIQQRFLNLTTNLRCLVCQNQNLAESNSGLANDLRTQIYTQVNQGKTDVQIINYLVQRYGSFILYSPPFKLETAFLWLAPALMLFSGLGYLIYYLKRNLNNT
jgi:cytochrome c-type biogenesis protein CcmH